MPISQNDSLGFVAALISCIASGSFAAPIKLKAAQTVNMDPLVLQTYKLGATFLTSWLVLLFGVKFSFTPWGFVSGLFVVPGGTAGYYAVQNAGLAASQGIWCSCKVLVAFFWGLLIFHEPVKSVGGTLASMVCLIAGLVGMSYFSSKVDDEKNSNDTEEANDVEKSKQEDTVPFLEMEQNDEDESSISDEEEDDSLPDHPLKPLRLRHAPIERSDKSSVGSFSKTRREKHRFMLGVLAALIDGGYGGSVFVPMHYADPGETKGLSFLISFAIGCSSVMVVFWFLRFLLCAAKANFSITAGWNALPSFHFQKVGPYASLAGFIWSIGNVSCMLSVAYLGQGIGYSLVQSQLLVAGLWGICYFKEIQEPRNIFRWFLSAGVTLAGIFLLSREHIQFTSTLPTEEETLV